MNIQMNLSDILKKDKGKDHRHSKPKSKNKEKTSLSESSKTPNNISKTSSKTPPSNTLYSRNSSKTFLTKPDLSKSRVVTSPTGVITSPAGASILNVTQGSVTKASKTVVNVDMMPSSTQPAQLINNKTFAVPSKAISNTTFVEPKGRAQRRSKPFISDPPPLSPSHLSSSFDEFNVSTWDFLDEDLLALKDEPVDKSPKRKPVNSPDKSPTVKRVKLNSPLKKSPLQFRENCTGARLAGVTRNLNTTFDKVTPADKRTIIAYNNKPGPSVKYSVAKLHPRTNMVQEVESVTDTDSVEFSLMKGPESMGLLPCTPPLPFTPPHLANCSLAESPMKTQHSTIEQGKLQKKHFLFLKSITKFCTST